MNKKITIKILLNQKGVSLYLAVVVMTALLAIVFGTSTILSVQFKTIKGMEHSVSALYAADTGIERALKDIFEDPAGVAISYNGTLNNGASYSVDVVCCGAGSNCVPCLTTGMVVDPNCEAIYYCVKSRGYFGPPTDRTKTQRAIQVSL